MIQIENTLVSFDIFEKKFSCDLWKEIRELLWRKGNPVG